MKNKRKSLRWNNWKYLFLFSAVILLSLWILQFVLFDVFYEQLKVNELRSIGESIVKTYETTNRFAELRQYALQSNLNVMLVDETGRGIGVDGFGRSYFGEGERIIITQVSPTVLTDTPTAYIEKQLDLSISVYIHPLSTVEGTRYLVITSPIPENDSTKNVLVIQYTIISILIVLLSIGVAHYISKKMTKPIAQLTKSARQLAQGNYQTTFAGEGYLEVQELADSLTYATTELSKVDTYRKELMANVSHDLKTPLTIIKFYNEMIRDFSWEDAVKREEHTATILREIDTLTNMVNDVLEVSKLESSTISMQKETISLSKLVQETCVAFSVVAKKEEYQLLTHIENDVYMEGDRLHIKRVLYNLIANAITYTGEDKKVQISLYMKDGMACVEVKDTGKGIPEEEQHTIWDRYYKSKDTHIRAIVGTGLGLSIVKSILTLHHALFGVYNNTDSSGSTFWFRIPVIQNTKET